MSQIKLLVASDLHYCDNLAEEIDTNSARLPAGTYNHQVDRRLYWHNYMLVEQMGEMLAHLRQVAVDEVPDLLVLTGDLVNTNWSKNVAAVAEKLRDFPCPVQIITGNHDVYLDGRACQLQEAIALGTYESGMRHEWLGEVGLIFLDLYVEYAAGDYAKWLDVDREVVGCTYRPQDVEAALAWMEEHPARPFLVFGHFPMISPDERLRAPRRKIGWRWDGGARLGERLQQPNNLCGIVGGHQHFAHLRRFEHGFHWTLPSLVEYPNAAAVLEVETAPDTGTGLGEVHISGQLVYPDPEMAEVSLAPRGEAWTAGEEEDRAFQLSFGSSKSRQ